MIYVLDVADQSEIDAGERDAGYTKYVIEYNGNFSRLELQSYIDEMFIKYNQKYNEYIQEKYKEISLEKEEVDNESLEDYQIELDNLEYEFNDFKSKFEFKNFQDYVEKNNQQIKFHDFKTIYCVRPTPIDEGY